MPLPLLVLVLLALVPLGSRLGGRGEGATVAAAGLTVAVVIAAVSTVG